MSRVMTRAAEIIPDVLTESCATEADYQNRPRVSSTQYSPGKCENASFSLAPSSVYLSLAVSVCRCGGTQLDSDRSTAENLAARSLRSVPIKPSRWKRCMRHCLRVYELASEEEKNRRRCERESNESNFVFRSFTQSRDIHPR